VHRHVEPVRGDCRGRTRCAAPDRGPTSAAVADGLGRPNRSAWP
jgi:hypothetical protein